MAQRGRKDWRSRRTWHLAAALRRRCLAQSSERAISWMVVESTTWMRRLKRKANFGDDGCRRRRVAKFANVPAPPRRVARPFSDRADGWRATACSWAVAWPRAVPTTTRSAAAGVTDVIEPEAVGELGIKQTDDVTPRTKGAGLIFHAGLACQSRHQMRRNEVAKLAQQREFAGGWLVSCLIFHALPCGKAQTRKPTFFYTSTLNPVSQQWTKTIKKAYQMFRRKNRANYHIQNNKTREQRCLGTSDRHVAQRLLDAENQAQEMPALNLQLGRVYMTNANPEMGTRTP